MSLARYIRTIRHLKTRQILAQARNRIRSKFENPARILSREAPPFPGCRWQPIGPFLPPGVHQNERSNILAGSLEFINQKCHVDWPPTWDFSEASRLWQYNLHYFDWLWALDLSHTSRNSGSKSLDLSEARSAVVDWIENHGPARGRVGWEPYPIALRLMNWCSFFFGEHLEETTRDRDFTNQLWTSVWHQAEWLSTHLEFHLQGNHLMEDAAALALVGACFAGTDASRWRRLALDLLDEQIDEQFLDDGMHFELSPMYHSRMLYVLLSLYNTGDDDISGLVRSTATRALSALAKTIHPDGGIALLNDSAFNVYNEPAELFEYGRSLGLLSTYTDLMPVGCWALEDSGYYGYRGDDGFYVICDAGPIGPDHIPGHAHADMLSFELSLGGQRVIVDSGVFDYEAGEARRHSRSTAAHSTVEIGAEDQAEMWGVFRVGRRGRPRDVSWRPNEKGFRLVASHDGYARLPGRPMHRRTFVFDAGRKLTVTDRVTSSLEVTCRTRLHLHPDSECVMSSDNSVVIVHRAYRFSITFNGNGSLALESGAFHPSFSISEPISVVTWTWSAGPGHNESSFALDFAK